MRRRLAIAVLAAAVITAAAVLTKVPLIPTETPSPLQPGAPQAEPFPSYPGSTILEYYSEPVDGGRMILAVCEVRADAKTVASWYANSLEGWVKAVEEEGGRVNF